MTSIQDFGQRWRLLLPPDTVVVLNEGRAAAVRAMRELPPATRVALAGGRRLRRLARRAGVVPETEYVALPSLATPIAITQVSDQALRWTARSVLTVPSGVRRGHAAFWLAVRLVQVFPRLLVAAPAGDRIVVGVRR